VSKMICHLSRLVRGLNSKTREERLIMFVDSEGMNARNQALYLASMLACLPPWQESNASDFRGYDSIMLACRNFVLNLLMGTGIGSPNRLDRALKQITAPLCNFVYREPT